MMDAIGSGLNSNFSTALLGSLAGAFAGAIAAQRIAQRSKQREEILKELRAINSAIMVAGTICNTVIAAKTQLIRPLWECFKSCERELKEFEQQRATGQRQGNAPFHYTADLRIFPCPTLPISVLQDLVFNRISVYGRPLSIVSILSQSIVEMKYSYAKREEIIMSLRTQSLPVEEFVQHYFGIPNAANVTNRDHPDILSAMNEYTDDCIFFSSLLCEDLTDYGRVLRKQYERKFGKDAPAISHADFSTGRASGTVPPNSKYEDWLKGFPEQHNGKSEENRGEA
jgi:hypothetical protein